MSVSSSTRPSTNPNTRIILLAGCLILCVAFGVRSSYGLFVGPISEELGWGREVLAFSLAIQNLIWGMAQPFSSMIAERYGAGRVLVASLVLYAAGIILGAYGYSPLTSHMGAGFFVGVGLGGASFSVILAVIGRAVPEEKRSVSLGIATASASLGQFLIIPTGSLLIETQGWQEALLILALLLIVVSPASWFLKGKSEADTRSSPEDQIDEKMSDTILAACHHTGFWLLTTGFFVCGFQLAFVTVHLPSYAVDMGMAPWVGAWTLALVGIANIFGSYLSGALGGRYRKKYLLAWIYIARTLLIVLFLMLPPSVESFMMFGLVMGVLWLSTVPLTAGLVAQIFGARYMGTLYGIVFLSHQLGSFAGVWLGGALFDATRSYEIVWWVCAILGLIAALLHWPIADKPLPREALIRQTG
ncbi:MFS transporter [Kiloniella sp. b19]|uniref:MFS transporter n=1 Tax=Kiloniella sp. GXU_MW_B19 TaxID=3141326 RepID=UPI0031DE841F